MDEKDEKIIKILKENAKLSTHEISKQTLIPITTVHNRIKKLEKEGFIKGYTLNLDYQKIGKPLAAYTLISLDYKCLKEAKVSQEQFAKKLRSYEEVEEACMVTGAFDMILKIRAKDIVSLDKFITGVLRGQKGIGTTQTLMVLHEL
ncbi:Lrp/AsnC family transcriptional regulator [Candidatus Woesearchaeota archaeon]|nr:Lrp/AsnC family transcriptional regulator [Candidatus Woesearchaeota archaeon]